MITICWRIKFTKSTWTVQERVINGSEAMDWIPKDGKQNRHGHLKLSGISPFTLLWRRPHQGAGDDSLRSPPWPEKQNKSSQPNFP